jgi:hypothetical protein
MKQNSHSILNTRTLEEAYLSTMRDKELSLLKKEKILDFNFMEKTRELPKGLTKSTKILDLL